MSIDRRGFLQRAAGLGAGLGAGVTGPGLGVELNEAVVRRQLSD